MLLKEGRAEIRRRNSHTAQQALAEELESLLAQAARQLRWGTKTGTWLSVPPSTLNETELGA